MTYKQNLVFTLINQGKNYAEIAHLMGINLSNLHSTVYQMRRKGIKIQQKKARSPLPVTPMQLIILTGYMEKESVPSIAKRLNVTCQTVMNHASAGFFRMGLTERGVDRVAALRGLLEPTPAPVTMADPFFS